MQQTWDWIRAMLLGNAKVVLIAAGVVGAFMLLEGWRRAGQGGGLRHRGYNLLVFGFNLIGMAVAGLLLDRIEGWLPESGLIGRLLPGWWPTGKPGWHNLLLATLLYTVVYDFFHYWAHRAQHEFAPFWLFHRVHHNDPAMDASTSVRHSLGAGVIGTVLAHFPTYLLCGGGLLPFAGSVALFWVWFFFSHANLRLPLGRLGWVIVGPQLHRLHHGRSEAYHNRNYAQFFPFYDWLFGTLRMPVGDEWPATGVEGDDLPRSAFSQVFLPWRRPASASESESESEPQVGVAARSPG